MTKTPEAALVAGVGEGLGAAAARSFAAAGHRTVLAARSWQGIDSVAASIRESGGFAHAVSSDLTDEAQVSELFDAAEREAGPVGLVLFNAAAFHRAPLVETGGEDFDRVWRASCHAGFLVGREAARRMIPRRRGTILFTGATASLRGSAQFAAFAAAKAGLRAVAQSMARELGPQGIHVGHVVVDGLIDTTVTRTRFPGYVETLPPDGLLRPESIALAMLELHRQPRDAWTFELDLRPWCERF